MIFQYFAGNCIEMKETGGGTSLAPHPSLDQSMTYLFRATLFKANQNYFLNSWMKTSNPFQLNKYQTVFFNKHVAKQSTSINRNVN